jgi:uncharacterized protein YjbI with pentapeptide repeats
MTKIPNKQFSSMKIVTNRYWHFARRKSGFILIALGITTFSALWVIQQNNINKLEAKISSLKNNIDLADKNTNAGRSRDQSFTIEKKLSLEKDILVIEKDKSTIQNGVYTTLVQALGGIILSITAYIGYRNFKVAEDKQVTERFSKSIEHLGNEKIDIRLGGIYALEQISIDSSKYHWTIMEILSAFVREKSKETSLKKLEKMKEDMQAALTVMNRRCTEQDPQGKKINLMQVNLKLVEFQAANISGVNLSRSDFTSANFSGSDFSNSDLMNSDFSYADFSGVNFSGVNFSGSDLRNVKFFQTNLSGADFSNSDISDSYLCESNLTNAKLIGTNLNNAHLGSDYTGNDYDDEYYPGEYEEEQYDPDWNLPANLSGALLIDAKLIGTKLMGADLSKSTMLTRQQIDSAIISEYTKLPDYLKPKSQN